MRAGKERKGKKGREKRKGRTEEINVKAGERMAKERKGGK